MPLLKDSFALYENITRRLKSGTTYTATERHGHMGYTKHSLVVAEDASKAVQYRDLAIGHHLCLKISYRFSNPSYSNLEQAVADTDLVSVYTCGTLRVSTLSGVRLSNTAQ